MLGEHQMIAFEEQRTQSAKRKNKLITNAYVIR